MTRIVAEAGALSELSRTLLVFERRLADVQEQFSACVEETRDAHVRERHRCEREIDHYEWLQAQSYDEDEGGPDYSEEIAELRSELDEISAGLSQVDEAQETVSAAWRVLHSHFVERLPPARPFLGDLVQAVKEYSRLALARIAHTLLASGDSSVAGIGHVALLEFLRAVKDKREIGDMGERAVEQLLLNRYGMTLVPFDAARYGYDRVFRAPGRPLVIVESKVNANGKLQTSTTDNGKQMSTEWTQEKARIMRDRSSALWSSANERIGLLVESLPSGDVIRMAVVINPTTWTADVYEAEGDNWNLVEAGISEEPGTEDAQS